MSRFSRFATASLVPLFLIPVLPVTALAATAEENAERADQPDPAVVVTATRLPSRSDRPVADAVTLTPDAIIPGQPLADLLATQSDIAVQRQGGAAGFSSILVRGAKPNFTLVMIEGIPLNDQTNSRGGAADAAGIGTALFDRVEVVRGPLSSLYGSGAVQGVVNLVLPQVSRAPEWAGTVSAGTDGGTSAALALRGAASSGLGAVAGGDFARTGLTSPGTSRVNWSAFAKLAPLDGGDGLSLFLRASGSDLLGFPDASGGERLALRRTLESRRARQYLGGARWTGSLAPRLGLEINASASLATLEDITPGVAPGIGSAIGVPAGTGDDRYRLLRTQAIMRWTGPEGLALVFGGEFEAQRGKDVSELVLFGRKLPSTFLLTRKTPALFAEAGLKRGGLDIDASARIDFPEGLGARATGQLALAWQLGGGLALRAQGGHSFKAPSFYALGNAFIGNPGLRPETADTVETGLDWTPTKGLRLSTRLFLTHYHDLVDFDLGPPPRLLNRSSVLTRGVMADLDLALTDTLSTRASVTYADTHNTQTGAHLLEVPAWRATGAIEWRPAPRWLARISGEYTGRRLDTAIPTGNVTLPSYLLVNAQLRRTLADKLDLSLGVANLFDRYYEDSLGFPAPPLTATVSISRRF